MVPKRTYPSVRNIRQDQTNFSNANDEMKGEAKIQTRDIWLKACKSFIQMQYPSIATLLHPLFFWLMCQHLKGTLAQCVRKGVRTWDSVRRQDLTEADTCLWSQHRRCTAGTCFPLIEWTRATNFHQFDSLFILHCLTDAARGTVPCKVKYDSAHWFIADRRFSFGIVGRLSTPFTQMTM